VEASCTIGWAGAAAEAAAGLFAAGSISGRAVFCCGAAGAAGEKNEDRKLRFFCVGASAAIATGAASPAAGAAACSLPVDPCSSSAALSEGVGVAVAGCPAEAAATSVTAAASEPGRSAGAAATLSGRSGSPSSTTKLATVCAVAVWPASAASDGSAAACCDWTGATSAAAKPNGTSESEVAQEARSAEANAARRARFPLRIRRVPSAFKDPSLFQKTGKATTAPASSAPLMSTVSDCRHET